MNKLFLLTILLVSIFSFVPKALADNSSGPSASLQTIIPKESEDSRVKILKSFLEKYDSPLTGFATEFVENADRYNLDWRLVAAISGLESTFGKFIPYNSYNGWGWGVYGDNVIRFSSWNDGIQTVSKGLRENYIDKWGAENIYQIGRLYAASPTWASRVSYLMNKIQEYALSSSKDSLSLSL